MPPDADHPGVFLLERYLKPLGLTPAELAKSIRVPVRRVSELVKGRRSLSRDMAARLALFFDVPPFWWLELQARYDADCLHLEALRDVVTPYEGLADVLVKPNGVERLPPAQSHRESTSTVSVSAELVANLRAQAKLAMEVSEDTPRTVEEKTFADGTVALVGR